MKDQWRIKVDMIINGVSEKEGVDWSQARAIVHKYVCGGKCGWYKTNSRKAGFNRHDLSDKQKKLIKETVKQVMKDLTVEEAKWQIHEILCPGHPKPPPKRNISQST
ncbi:hypothetical protein KAU88_03225 [Candidatus Bathyarchaeota archaeon]|nr:hypothetical protein [Candidatus Bathyarchaeota archaeon]